MKESSKEILKEVLTEQMEAEANTVPPEEEIRTEHTFSKSFLEKMRVLVKKQEALQREYAGVQEKKKEQGHRVLTGFSEKRANRTARRILTACLVCVVLLGVGALGYQGLLRAGSSSSADSSSAEMATMSAETYDEAETDTGYTDEIYEEDAEAATMDASSGSEVSESAAAEESSGSGGDRESADDGLSETDDSSYEQKLIRTVNLNVETTEFDALITQLETKTEEFGGYVESSETNSSSGAYYGRWSSMTIRIPADSLDEFVSMVGENANVTYTSESTEDVTLTYVDLESHLTALRTEQESLLSMLEAAETVEDIISIQSQLTEVRYEIESYESQLRVYDNKVNYSTVYLYIDEVERETAAADETFWGSVGTKFNDNVYRLGQGFRNFVIGFLGALPIILVIAVPVAVILLIIHCAMKRRQRKIEKSFEEIEEKEES